MSAEDSLGNRGTARCEVWGGGWGLSCWWKALPAVGLLLALVLCLEVLMKETSSGSVNPMFQLGTRLVLPLIHLICKRWGIQQQSFWLFLLFRTIYNFHLWTLGLHRNSLYGSEFICIALLAWLWFSLTVTSAGKRRMELDMKNCFVLQSF